MTRTEAATSRARAPRGTRPVTQAFLAALDAIPEAARPAVAKAAQAMIRDELKNRRDKLKAVAAKEKARRPAASARTRQSAGSHPAEDAETAPVKRRSRKQTDVPAAA